MAIKTKLGRPPKPDHEKHSAVLYLKLTPAERTAINAAARSEPVSLWAKRILLRAAKRA